MRNRSGTSPWSRYQPQASDRAVRLEISIDKNLEEPSNSNWLFGFGLAFLLFGDADLKALVIDRLATQHDDGLLSLIRIESDEGEALVAAELIDGVAQLVDRTIVAEQLMHFGLFADEGDVGHEQGRSGIPAVDVDAGDHHLTSSLAKG